MFKILAAFAATVILSSCAAPQDQSEDPALWGRFDCKRLGDTPELQVQFDQAKSVCVNRAEAAGIAGTASMPSSGYGIGNAIADGISQGIAGGQIQVATAKSCMAEYGYTLAKRSEHEARCPVRAPAPVAPAPKSKRKS